MFVLIKRIFITGWHGITRDGGMITANIFIMTMAIFMISSLFFFRDLSAFLVANIQERADVSVYFKNDAREEDILKVKREVDSIPEVKEVNYISSEEAFERFIERHSSNPVLMESLAEVGTNPFLASLGVKAFEADQYAGVVGFLENFQFNYLIEKIDYYERKPVIERIYGLTAAFSRVGVIVSVILILVAVMITFNAVRISIYNSREEIKIQRLVGASNLFIKGPFLVQGAISGFFSALICFLFFALLAWGLDTRAEFLFPGFGLLSFFIANLWMILSIQILSGIGLGVVSSFIAVKKYLKV